MTRSKLIQLIHVGAGKMFPGDEDARRDWQQAVTGCRSCSAMTDKQLQQLVDELFDKGFLKRSRAPRRAGRVPFNRSPYMDKIEAQLADMGLSWQYAESIAWRITGGKGTKHNSQGPGVQRLEWVRKREHFEGIIAALEVEQRKRGCLESINESLQKLGKGTDYVDAMLVEKKRGRWHRDLPLLESIAKRLYDELDLLEMEADDAH